MPRPRKCRKVCCLPDNDGFVPVRGGEELTPIVLKVDALICGGIGGGAQMALAAAGIQLYGGVSGNADAAAEALVTGSLAYNPNVMCNHHGEHHHEGDCGNHSCGHHSCG